MKISFGLIPGVYLCCADDYTKRTQYSDYFIVDVEYGATYYSDSEAFGDAYQLWGIRNITEINGYNTEPTFDDRCLKVARGFGHGIRPDWVVRRDAVTYWFEIAYYRTPDYPMTVTRGLIHLPARGNYV